MEFNPGFSFDDGSTVEKSHPWSFSSALLKAHKQDPRLTTLDEKIKKKLQPTVPRNPMAEAKDQDDTDGELPGGAGELDDGDDELEDSEDDSGLEEEENSDNMVNEDDETNETGLGHVSGQETGRSGAEVTGSHSKRPQLESKQKEDKKLNAQQRSTSIRGDTAQMRNKDEDEDDDEDSDVEHDKATRSGTKSKTYATEQENASGFFAHTPAGTKYTARAFTDLGLSRPLLKAVSNLGYSTPTPIQAAVVPLALSGRDIVASAVTGSGKTAAFALPILERLLFRQRSVAATHILILCPTRELAAQVHGMICQLAKFTDIRAALAVGGLPLAAQAAELRQAPEIVVATPGRIIDHVMNTMAFELDTLSALVLDEADRLLELGFKDELQQILKHAPKKRQTMLFSATMTSGVQQLIKLSLSSPVRLAADMAAAVPRSLKQEVLRLKGGVAAANKIPLLCALCSRTLRGLRTIIFCRQKRQAHRLKILFGLVGIPQTSELHGDMTQAARLQALESFRTGDSTFLLATDVAARGLDISGVQAVVNFDCPSTLETYLHRVGRTARAGAEGIAISLVEDQDRALIKLVMKKVTSKLDKREIPKNILKHWCGKVEEFAPKIDEILQEEKEEKAMRMAEMEAAKASNILEHEAEIYSRPKREWFQTEREKKATARAAVESMKRSMELLNADNNNSNTKKVAKVSNKGSTQPKSKTPPAHVADTQNLMGSVKAAKSAARQLREGGTKPREAAKAALTATGATKREKQKKRKKCDHDNGDQKDSSDLKVAKASHVYAGGCKSGKLKLSKVGGLSKVQQARVVRGGKGKGQFKGKARYKRK